MFLNLTIEEIKDRIPENQLVFKASRSRGPGGQNVNKVSTRIEVRFDIAGSPYLNDSEKARVMSSLAGRINSSGELIVISQSERTQLMNKRKAVERFYKLLASALTVKEDRKPTKPTRASKNTRLDDKKKHSGLKKLRSGNINTDPEE